MLDTIFLASLMVEPDKIGSLNKDISILDFSDETYYEIYSVMAELIISSSISYPNLKFRFKDDSLILDIINLMESEEPVDPVAAFGALCEDSRKQRLKVVGEFLYNQADTNKDSRSILSSAESKLMGIAVDSGLSLTTVLDMEPDFVETLKNAKQKFDKYKNIRQVLDLPTGFNGLDLYTLGMHKKTSCVLAGATSDGKTQLAVQFSNTLLDIDKCVLYFMLEDCKENLIHRFISLRTAINLTKIRLGNLSDIEYRKIMDVYNDLKQMNRLLVEDRLIEIDDVIIKIKFAKLKYPNLSMVVIDNINLMIDTASKSGNREQEISKISKKLLGVAKEQDIALLVVQQVNTSPDMRSGGMPMQLNDLRDCKAVGHDASIVIFIYCPDKHDEGKGFSRKHVQLILAKNRYGDVNKIMNLVNYASVAKMIEEESK
jgi:replicative DNA helicase